MSDPNLPPKEWWHVFGGEVDSGLILGDDEPSGTLAWATVTAGPTKKGPDDAQHMEFEGLSYRGSYNHEPSDEEKDAWTPENYQD